MNNGHSTENSEEPKFGFWIRRREGQKHGWFRFSAGWLIHLGGRHSFGPPAEFLNIPARHCAPPAYSCAVECVRDGTKPAH
jgi:hypothetical protein